MEADLIKQLEAKPLDTESLSNYEKWALSFFHNKHFISKPLVEFTIQLDVTKAFANYEAKYKGLEDASFTAYLTYCLVQSLKKFPCLLYRRIKNEWYRCNKLPVFFPVATGTNERFHEVFMEEAFKQDWPAFCKEYRQKIDMALAKDVKYVQYSEELFQHSFVIANMPYLSFTSFSMHMPYKHTGRSVFYFGKRYEDKGKKLLPLYISCDHSNCDPFIVNQLMDTFNRITIS